MDKPSSFLFSGTHFDRKRFAKDFARFQPKQEAEITEFTEKGEAEKAEVEVSLKMKRRKTKTSAAHVESVEGFSVFRSSESTAEDKTLTNNELFKKKKEIDRQIEIDAVLRKKHGIHISGYNVPSPLQNFSELSSRFDCKAYLLHNLADLGIREPTPIQRQAIPVFLSGRECFACAPTGSGKTLAFVCPILMKLKPGLKAGIRAVILCPTRELAAQTTRECKKLAKGSKFYIKLMTKDLAKAGDFEKMPCDILVSTPLRLDLAMRNRKLDLSRVEYLVLDESDKLFELGFVEQIDSVVKACSNPSIIRSLFSATLPDSVEEIARTIMHDAVRIIVGRKNSASELINQKLIFAGTEEGKLLALRQKFSESLDPPILVFVQSKERAKQLYKELAFDDIKVDVIHADLTEAQREDAVDNFRAGKTWMLIATDVMARGMDFKGVNCVINYDFPESAAAYIHRIGRCGRAGRTGDAISLYTEEDVPFLRNIANVIAASGCEVPSWMLSLQKLRKKKHRPQRDSILSGPQEDTEAPHLRWKRQQSQKGTVSDIRPVQKESSSNGPQVAAEAPNLKRKRQQKTWKTSVPEPVPDVPKENGKVMLKPKQKKHKAEKFLSTGP
ncbi:DEAD-box ATP-dependent RNA helicase 57 [Aristolochia californica]|uniref:DEAD-box ATP-dependent RNA helicase 57 n=1 Tax=Aristolochia californica TaxID=171875 RepID=UPI0035D56588